MPGLGVDIRVTPLERRLIITKAKKQMIFFLEQACAWCSYIGKKKRDSVAAPYSDNGQVTALKGI